MTDQVFNRAELAEAVGNDIADMAHFGCCGSFNSRSRRASSSRLSSIRDSAIARNLLKTKSWPTTWRFTDWLLFERPYYHGKTLLELYVDEPPASISPASLGRLKQV